MDAKSDRKTKKSTLLSWRCGDWIEIVESERKSGTIFVTSIQCKICMKHQKKLMTLRNWGKLGQTYINDRACAELLTPLPKSMKKN